VAVSYICSYAQGAKAQQKRERNADKAAGKGGKSQLKVNEAAKSIVCTTCRQPFVSPHLHRDMTRPGLKDVMQMNTTREPA
jgi:RNase P subunit RPR2